LLSRIGLPAGRQGLARRFDLERIRELDLVAALSATGMPAVRALEIARDAGPDTFTRGLGLSYDRESHLQDLDRRLRDATERVVPRRRGRPPAL